MLTELRAPRIRTLSSSRYLGIDGMQMNCLTYPHLPETSCSLGDRSPPPPTPGLSSLLVKFKLCISSLADVSLQSSTSSAEEVAWSRFIHLFDIRGLRRILSAVSPVYIQSSWTTFTQRTRLYIRSQGSSVSIVSDYGLDDRGSIPDRGRGFFF
jgi:hypothetical protein